MVDGKPYDEVEKGYETCLQLFKGHGFQLGGLQLMMDLHCPLQLPQHLLAVLYAHARIHDGWHGRLDGCNVLLLFLNAPAFDILYIMASFKVSWRG